MELQRGVVLCGTRCRAVKRRKRIITDLSFDVLRHITYCVATSSNGATDLIMLSSVCRVFKELAGEDEVLKAVRFSVVMLPGLHESFWLRNGLLGRCMKKGNLSALHFAMQYADRLDATYKVHKRALFRGIVILLARIRAVDTVNTRLRRQRLELAEDAYKSSCDAADLDIKRGKEFIDMLQAVIK